MMTSTAVLVAARDLPEGTLLDLEEGLVEALVPDTFTAIVERARQSINIKR